MVGFIAIDCASSPQGLKLRIDMCNGFSVILKELAAREVARLAQRQVDYSRCSTPHTATLNSTHGCAQLHTQLYSTPHTAILHSTHSYAQLHTRLCSTPRTAILHSTHSYTPLHTQLCSTPHTAVLHSTQLCSMKHYITYTLGSYTFLNLIKLSLPA